MKFLPVTLIHTNLIALPIEVPKTILQRVEILKTSEYYIYYSVCVYGIRGLQVQKKFRLQSKTGIKSWGGGICIVHMWQSED